MDTLANSSIRLLTLDWNRVGAPTRRGVDALAHFLQNNHTLQHLSLQNNELGAEEIHSLLQALERNTGLLSLDLKWNPLGGRVGPLLAQALGANRALLYLELGGCDIATNDLDRID
jgi:Ran GTPase-activating protein (RanGAP) involved in mRNA processing and transport